MNLLPEKEELVPITNEKSTFYDCGFNKDFDDLSFKMKLQVLCDVVRQSIYPNGCPNPDTDVSQMNGNCYTASACYINYLKKLNIGNNVRMTIARQRNFDLDESTSIHILVLVDSNDGHVYQVDPVPFGGYKYGIVEDITYKKLYNEYYVINNNINQYLYFFRKIIYEDSIGKFDKTRINEYISICNDCDNYHILKGYASKVLKIIIKYLDNQHDKDALRERINQIKPFNKSNPARMEEAKIALYKQVEIWLEELKELKSNNIDIKRQLELAITIIQEIKMIDSSYERYANIDGQNVRLCCINPRFLYEKGYNTVFIKPSACYTSCDQIIKDGFIKKFGNPKSEYYADLSKCTEQLEIKPMLFSHPCGEEYIRSMTGKTNVLLFDGNCDDIYNLKKYYRNSLCKNMWCKNIIWTDGKPMCWHPFYTNLVHGADNYSESSLHFLIDYPEHQTMTRFMYPNPRLVKKL